MHGPTADTGDPPTPEQRFDDLYDSAGAAVLAYALRRCSNREDAFDVTAEAFAVAWRRRNEVPDNLDEARAWIFGVARLTLTSTNRRHQRTDRLGEALARALHEEVVPDPTALAEDNAQRATVRAALADLTPQDQELVQLTAWEGLTTAQAGAALGLSAGATRVRLHRARLRLRAALSPDPRTVKDGTDDH